MFVLRFAIEISTGDFFRVRQPNYQFSIKKTASNHAYLRRTLLLHCFHIATALLWHSISVAMQMLCSSNAERR